MSCDRQCKGGMRMRSAFTRHTPLPASGTLAGRAQAHDARGWPRALPHRPRTRGTGGGPRVRRCVCWCLAGFDIKTSVWIPSPCSGGLDGPLRVRPHRAGSRAAGAFGGWAEAARPLGEVGLFNIYLPSLLAHRASGAPASSTCSRRPSAAEGSASRGASCPMTGRGEASLGARRGSRGSRRQSSSKAVSGVT